MDTDEYCRQIEAHLCRRNEGHLVRITGPAFELVRGWAHAGIPPKVALQGIDRHVDRVSARGPQRRPIRIEFCEADVLDAFDAWRRAVGVHGAARFAAAGDDIGDAADAGVPERRARSRESLSTHLDRVIVHLTAVRSGDAPAPWDAAIDGLVRQLDAMHPSANRARGDARDRILAELAVLDARLLDAVRACAPPDLLLEATREADAELEPFAARLSPESYASAHRRCTDRVLRERLRLPSLAVE